MSNTQPAEGAPTPSPWTFGLGDRLGKALDVASVPHSEMAEYLGISANTIGNYISGRTKPKKQTLRLWAMRTGAPLGWLETGDDVGLGGLEPPTITVVSRQFDNPIVTLADVRARRSVLGLIHRPAASDQ